MSIITKETIEQKEAALNSDSTAFQLKVAAGQFDIAELKALALRRKQIEEEKARLAQTPAAQAEAKRLSKHCVWGRF